MMTDSIRERMNSACFEHYNGGYSSDEREKVIFEYIAKLEAVAEASQTLSRYYKGIKGGYLIRVEEALKEAGWGDTNLPQ